MDLVKFLNEYAAKSANYPQLELKAAADEIIALRSKLDRVSKLLSDWEEAERQGLGLSILGGINQLREALK